MAAGADPPSFCRLAFKQSRDFPTAEKLIEEALDGRLESLGPSHEATIDSELNLGVVYGFQEKFEDALMLFARALHTLRCLFGNAHPKALRGMPSLVKLFAVAVR